MSSYAAIFEIPALKLDRAIKFYQEILHISLEKVELPEMKMGIFPHEGQQTIGMVIAAEGYKPSTEGVVLYLNAGKDLQPILDRIHAKGGKILVPKTALADESGFFALFIDSEGNRLGLYSPE